MNLALAGLELTIVDKAVLELVMILLPLSLEHWDFWPVSQGPASLLCLMYAFYFLCFVYHYFSAVTSVFGNLGK